MIEAEDNYQGITLEERMALCHVFDTKEEDWISLLRLPDNPLLAGHTE